MRIKLTVLRAVIKINLTFVSYSLRFVPLSVRKPSWLAVVSGSSCNQLWGLPRRSYTMKKTFQKTLIGLAAMAALSEATTVTCMAMDKGDGKPTKLRGLNINNGVDPAVTGGEPQAVVNDGAGGDQQQQQQTGGDEQQQNQTANSDGDAQQQQQAADAGGGQLQQQAEKPADEQQAT